MNDLTGDFDPMRPTRGAEVGAPVSGAGPDIPILPEAMLPPGYFPAASSLSDVSPDWLQQQMSMAADPPAEDEDDDPVLRSFVAAAAKVSTELIFAMWHHPRLASARSLGRLVPRAINSSIRKGAFSILDKVTLSTRADIDTELGIFTEEIDRAKYAQAVRDCAAIAVGELTNSRLTRVLQLPVGIASFLMTANHIASIVGLVSPTVARVTAGIRALISIGALSNATLRLFIASTSVPGERSTAITGVAERVIETVWDGTIPVHDAPTDREMSKRISGQDYLGLIDAAVGLQNKVSTPSLARGLSTVRRLTVSEVLQQMDLLAPRPKRETDAQTEDRRPWYDVERRPVPSPPSAVPEADDEEDETSG